LKIGVVGDRNFEELAKTRKDLNTGYDVQYPWQIPYI
jgi:hypothetical protein